MFMWPFLRIQCRGPLRSPYQTCSVQCVPGGGEKRLLSHSHEKQLKGWKASSWPEKHRRMKGKDDSILGAFTYPIRDIFRSVDTTRKKTLQMSSEQVSWWNVHSPPCLCRLEATAHKVHRPKMIKYLLVRTAGQPERCDHISHARHPIAAVEESAGSDCSLNKH